MATVTASNDEPVALTDAINITAAEAEPNTTTGYDTDNYPASPQVLYYFTVEADGEDTLTSEVFSTSFAEAHTWPSVIIPAAGTWTAHLRLVEDDSSVANTTITAS